MLMKDGQTMKKLSDILTQVQPIEVNGDANRQISSLVCDSRLVEPNSVFFALPGSLVDGFEFIPQALAQGATTVVAEREMNPVSGVTFVLVNNVRQAMAKMSAAFYAQPTLGIPVIGITGTNGKTTTTYLLEAILQQAGYRPAVFGTIACRCGDVCYASSHTTPESIDLMRMMHEFREQGANAFVMEVSSHALEQHRVDGVDFNLGIFTNLTPEHLDYHHDLENYFKSKKRLFTELLDDGTALINNDDTFGQRLLEHNDHWISYGRKSAQVSPLQINVNRKGIHGSFKTPQGDVVIDSKMIGDFNVSNLLAAVSAAQQLGIENAIISTGIAAMPQVPGRLEAVVNNRNVLALVDYAHTGDALEQVLTTLANLDAGRRYSLVGCGGDRDPSKRPVMAATAVTYSDLSILTSDNPRTEDPLLILKQMKQGALKAGSKELTFDQARNGENGFVIIPDRREAINFACQLVTSGDLLLVAGKGHEDYQILGTKKVHFDDREELIRALTYDQFAEGADV
jgi:UDP-N-acetylmuramoyl-L-alanyl-D-glutamate--2,6-diaminopimelate ligase